MTFGSCFAGIGGLDLGLHRAGMECKWQIEIDPFCQKVLAKHWPGVKRYGDIREVDAGELDSVDLIAGGFPCQDVSLAGSRSGIGEGTRSGLYIELIRIIRQLRPKFVLLENVPGLLIPRNADEPAPISRVLGDLASCGYDAQWDCLPALAFGADHIRDRVFIVAKPNGFTGSIFQNSEIRKARSEIRQDIDQWGEKRDQGNRNPKRLRLDAIRRATQYGVLPLADGIPGGVDELRAVGNSIVPQVAEWLGNRIISEYLKSC